MAVYATVICVICGLFRRHLEAQYACLGAATYVMVLMNNQHGLIRIYSRMVSGAFLTLFVMANFLLSSTTAVVTALLYAAFYTILFHAYQDKRATGRIFYAFICLGGISMLFPQILFLLPILWVVVATKVLAMSVRTFWASVIGILTPYWLLMPLAMVVWPQSALRYAHQYLETLTHFGAAFDFSGWNAHHIAATAVVAALGVLGIAHFLHSSFNDKIRTRMVYEALIITEIALMACIAVQPQLYDPLMGMLIVNTAPLTGHFIALTKGRLPNITFIVIVAATLSVTLFNALYAN